MLSCMIMIKLSYHYDIFNPFFHVIYNLLIPFSSPVDTVTKKSSCTVVKGRDVIHVRIQANNYVGQQNCGNWVDVGNDVRNGTLRP